MALENTGCRAGAMLHGKTSITPVEGTPEREARLRSPQPRKIIDAHTRRWEIAEKLYTHLLVAEIP
jgi:hypothetical protein